MAFMLFLLALLALAVFGFYFSKTSKEMPRTWHEWKTEFQYQYTGIHGLIHDFKFRSRDRVVLSKQPGRIVVITGGNRGIGLRVIEKLLACDMTVVMGVRDPVSSEKAVQEIVDFSTTKGKLICEKLDVGDLQSVKDFAARVKAKFDKVHILINNAGIMFAPFRLTADNFESHLAVNYLGHFLLTHLLMPNLKAAGHKGNQARVVNVSSCVNIIGRINYRDINGLKLYHPGTAYSQSKLAQILATRHMQTVLDAENAFVQAIALNPGIVDTDLFEYSATTSVPLFKKLFFKTPERGARTVVYAAIDPGAEGGVYLSNCGKGPMHPSAKKPEKCEKLFKFTCDLLKIEHFGDGRV